MYVCVFYTTYYTIDLTRHELMYRGRSAVRKLIGNLSIQKRRIPERKKGYYTWTMGWNIFFFLLSLKTNQVVNDRIFFSRILSCGIITPRDFFFQYAN